MPPAAVVPRDAPADGPVLSAEVVHYYLYCDQSLSSPFQQVQGGWAPPLVLPGAGGGSVTVPHSLLQALTVFQRSLTTMQIQIQGLIQYALPLFPTAKVQEGGTGGPHPSFCSPELPDPPFPTERPAGGPAAPQLLRDQPAPADGPAGLPGAAQGEGGPTGDQLWGPPAAPPALPCLCPARITWMASSGSATTAWRGCSTSGSSPCWRPPPSPP